MSTIIFLLLLILMNYYVRKFVMTSPSCFISIKWYQAGSFLWLSYKLGCLYVGFLVALAILFAGSWYHWMSSLDCLMLDFTFLSKIFSPLVSRTHKSIHEFKVFFLIDFIVFVNKYWFHNALIEFFPIIFNCSFLLSLGSRWIRSKFQIVAIFFRHTSAC